MKLFISTTMWLFVALSAMAITAGQPAPQELPRRHITLNIDGVTFEGCAQALSSALNECQAKLLTELHPQTDRPSRVEVSCPRSFDLAACAARLNQLQPPTIEGRSTTMDLVLFATMDEQSAREALSACHRIGGVDGAASKADIIKGELHIRIVGNKAVTPEQIVLALRELGIVAQFNKSNSSLTNT